MLIAAAAFLAAWFAAGVVVARAIGAVVTAPPQPIDDDALDVDVVDDWDEIAHLTHLLEEWANEGGHQ